MAKQSKARPIERYLAVYSEIPLEASYVGILPKRQDASSIRYGWGQGYVMVVSLFNQHEHPTDYESPSFDMV